MDSSPRLAFPLARSTVALLALLHAACSASNASTSTDAGARDGASPADAGAVDAGPPPPGMATNTGMVMDYDNPLSPVPGVTVTAGTATATTDTKGRWSLDVPLNTPVSLLLTAPTYTNTYLGEMIQTGGTADLGPILLPKLDTFHLGQQVLSQLDPTQGIVYVVAKAIGSCTSVAGGTFTVNSPAGARTTYFKGYLPSTTQTSFRDQTPVAAIYNIPPGAHLDLTVMHPTCTPVSFPATVGNVIYTGNVTVEGGDANSALNVYLE